MTTSNNLASQAFEVAIHRASIRKFFTKIFGKRHSLMSFQDVQYLLKPQNSHYSGLRAVEIDKIIGSEDRYNDFDREFLPLKHEIKMKWQSVASASYEDKELPPVDLHKIGNYYFVRDGHHRISVARFRGQKYIDAYVVESSSRVSLEKGMIPKDLLLKEGYLAFLEETNIDQLIGEEINLTTITGYLRLVDHVNKYIYFKRKEAETELSKDELIKEWYDTLYKPTITMIQELQLLKRYPQRKEGDFFIWIMDHWHYLKEKYGDSIELREAVFKFSQKTATYVKK